jgi:hypothetical protein
VTRYSPELRDQLQVCYKLAYCQQTYSRHAVDIQREPHHIDGGHQSLSVHDNCGALSQSHLVPNKRIRIPVVCCPSAPVAIDGTDHYHSSFGIGTTWHKDGESGFFYPELVEITKEAIKRGYRHLDTAEAYRTEEEPGVAMKEPGVPLDQLFVTTKVLETVDDVPKAIGTSLKKMQLDYVDL